MPTFNLPSSVSPRRVQQLELDVAQLKAQVASLTLTLTRMERAEGKGKRQDAYVATQLGALTATVNHLAGHIGMAGE